jgi:hypothetical protein
MKTLVDGLGYDEIKEQYYTVTYAWKNLTPEDVPGITIGKSGITKYDVKTAMSEAVPTRGKQYHQEALWGFKDDRKHLPKGISIEQANRVVANMDVIFKQDMIESGWNRSVNKKSKGLGTEFYEGPTNIWLDTIKSKWNDAFINAQNNVLGHSINEDKGDITTMGNQGLVIEQINEVLNIHHKVRAVIPCAYGKSFIMFAGGFKWDVYKNKKFLVYYCHNIPATKQLSVAHSRYAEGTIYQNEIKRIVVCSESKQVKGQTEYGIENYSASDYKLDELIIEYIKSPQRVAFYVNNMSAGLFNSKFKQIADGLNYTETPGTIIDESQEFCGIIGMDKTDAVLKSIGDYQVSFTATERRRRNDTNPNRIYNSDIEHFGHIAVEKTPSETIEEGRSCPIHFKTVEVSDNHTLMREIENNSSITTIFSDKITKPVRGRMLRSIVCLVKSIREDKRTHPLLITNLITDTKHAIVIVNILKELNIIPNDYKIVNGLRENGLDEIKKFNEYCVNNYEKNYKKVIKDVSKIENEL